MPKFTFRSPEGKSYTVTGPEGSTPAQAFQILQGQIGAQAKAAPSAADLVNQIPGGYPAGTSTPAPRKPATGNQDVIGVLQGASIPGWNLLQTVPIPAVQRFAAKRLQSIEQTSPPAAKAVGEGISYALPVGDIAEGATAARAGTTYLERALTGAGKGAAYGIGLTGSQSPSDVASRKLAAGVVGAAAGPAAEAIPEVPSLFRNLKYASGKEAAKASELLRGEVGSTLEKPAQEAKVAEPKGKRIAEKIAKRTQDIEAKAAKRAGLAPVHPSETGAELGSQVEARQKNLARMRSEQAASDKSAALQEASDLEAQGKHASSTPQYRALLSDIHNRLQTQGGRETPLGNFYRDLLNKLEDRPTGETEQVVQESRGAMGEPVTQTVEREKMQPATLAELDPVRRGLLDKLNPEAEGYSALVANEAKHFYGKLRGALGEAFPKYGKYLQRYQEESQGMEPFGTKLAQRMTKHQSPWSEESAKVTDPQNIPAQAFRSPEAFKQTAQALGDKAKASRYALNYFSHQLQGKSADQVDAFIRANKGVLDASGNASKLEGYAQRLRKLEEWKKNRETLADNVLKSIAGRDSLAKEYLDLKDRLDYGTQTDAVIKRADAFATKMLRDNVIDRAQYEELQRQIGEVRKTYENTEQGRASMKRLGTTLGLGMLSYATHRYLWDKFTGMF